MSGLVVQDDGGDKKLDRVSLSIAQGESVALIDDPGTGAETCWPASFGRSVWPSSGRVTIGGKALNEMPESLAGRRITYISSEDYLFQGSLGDNLLYGLQHALHPARTARCRGRASGPLGTAEARASGNSVVVRGADWLNRALIPADDDGARSLDAAVIATLNAAGLKQDVMGMGVRARVTDNDHADFKRAIVEIRHRLQRDQAEGKDRSADRAFRHHPPQPAGQYRGKPAVWRIAFGSGRGHDPEKRLRHRDP